MTYSRGGATPRSPSTSGECLDIAVSLPYLFCPTSFRPYPPRGSIPSQLPNYPNTTQLTTNRPHQYSREDVSTGEVFAAGAKSVELRFDNPNNDTGRLITLLALALAVALLVGGVVLDKRSARV